MKALHGYRSRCQSLPYDIGDDPQIPTRIRCYLRRSLAVCFDCLWPVRLLVNQTGTDPNTDGIVMALNKINLIWMTVFG